MSSALTSPRPVCVPATPAPGLSPARDRARLHLVTSFSWRPGDPVPLDTGVPRFVRVHPELAQAALRQRRQLPLAVWLLLRVAERKGSGRIAVRAAVQIISTVRGVTERHARRVLGTNGTGFWDIQSDFVWLRSAYRVAKLLGVHHVTRERLIDAQDLRGGAGLRAALAATCYRTDRSGSPLTRRLVAELTGVGGSTQRRYENQHGSAEKIAEVHVRQAHIPGGCYVGEIPEEFGRIGFYYGNAGALMRRHGDIRQSHHGLGARASARRLNRELAPGGRPAEKARGERPLRVYFLTPDGPARWLRCKEALGKVTVRTVAFHPVLDYSVVVRRGRRGQAVWDSIAEPRKDIV